MSSHNSLLERCCFVSPRHYKEMNDNRLDCCGFRCVFPSGLGFLVICEGGIFYVSNDLLAELPWTCACIHTGVITISLHWSYGLLLIVQISRSAVKIILRGSHTFEMVHFISVIMAFFQNIALTYGFVALMLLAQVG